MARGAETTVAVKDAPDPQRLPDIYLWEPRIETELRGSEMVIRWSSIDALPHGPEVKYEGHIIDTEHPGARPNPVLGPTTETQGAIDMRLVEDTKTRLVLTARSRIDEDQLTYRGTGRKIAPGPVAPSRGRPCLADAPNGELERTAEDPCPLTDGDLRLHEEVLLLGECSADSDPPCMPQTVHKKLCVDLEDLRTVRSVVVRSPFMDGLQVSLSADGRGFRRLGRPTSTTSISTGPRSPP